MLQGDLQHGSVSVPPVESADSGVDGRELECRIAEAIAIRGRNLVLLKGRLALQAVVN